MFQCFVVTFRDNIAASYYCWRRPEIGYDKSAAIQAQQDESTRNRDSHSMILLIKDYLRLIHDKKNMEYVE